MSSIFEIISKPLKLNPGVTTTPSPILPAENQNPLTAVPSPKPLVLPKPKPLTPVAPVSAQKPTKSIFEVLSKPFTLSSLKPAPDPVLPLKREPLKAIPFKQPTLPKNLDTSLEGIVRPLEKIGGGQFQMRLYAGVGNEIAKKLNLIKEDFKPTGAFQEELYGTNKSISARKTGREIRLADPEGESKGVFKYLDPTIGIVVGSLDALDGGWVSRTLRLSKSAKNIIARSKNADEIAELIQKETGATKEFSQIIAQPLVQITDVNEVDSIINRTKYELQELSRKKAAGAKETTEAATEGFEVTPERIAIANDSSKGIITEDEARKLMQATEEVKAPTAQVTNQDVTVYRGQGKGIGNSTLVKGEYYAGTKEFASEFGDVTETVIPKGSKVFDLDTAKNGEAGIPKELLVDQDALTKYIIDKGYDYTKNTNTRGIEYVKLNKTLNELESLAAESESLADFKQLVMKNYDKYRDELARLSKNYTNADNSRLRSPMEDIYRNIENRKLKEALSVAGERGFKEDIKAIPTLEKFLAKYSPEPSKEQIKTLSKEDFDKLEFTDQPHDVAPIRQLDPSEHDEFLDVYKMNDTSPKKIDEMAQWLRDNPTKDLRPVMVEGTLENKRLRPMVTDGHHRVAAYIKAGRENIPIQYDRRTLTEIYEKGTTAFKGGQKTFGDRLPTAEIKKIINEIVPEKDLRLMFDEDLLKDEGLLGRLTGPADLAHSAMKPLIKLYMKDGKADVFTAYHEAGHYVFKYLLTDAERAEGLIAAKKEMGPLSWAKYRSAKKPDGSRLYPTDEDILNEYIADKYADGKAKEKGFNTGAMRKTFIAIDKAIKRAINAIMDVWEKIKNTPNKEGGFIGGTEPKKKGGLPEQGGKKGGPSLPTEQGSNREIVKLEELPSIANDKANFANVKLNVKHYNISDEGKELIEKTIEEVKPEIEEAIGEVLSNKEALEFAERSSKTLEKVIERESTLEWEASLIRARQNLAQMSKTGMVNRDYIETLKAIKTNGTDIARKLQSYSIGADPKEISSMQAIIEAVLKISDNTEEILKAAEGVDFTNLSQATDFYRKYVGPTTSEWIDLIRYNSMLSSPKTHIINVFSNLLNTTLVAPIEKTITGGLDFMRASVTGNPRNFFSGDGGRYLKAYFMGANEATSRFAGVMNGTRAMTNLDTKHLPIATTGTKGKVVNTLSFPMRLLEASDQFFTALAEGGEKAVLVGRKERGVNVGNIETKAADEAAYRLFRQDLFDEKQGYLLDAIDQVTSKVQGFRNNPNPIVSNIAKFTVPFLRTPMNIFKQGVEYSPIGIGTIPGAKNKTEQFSKAVIGSAVFAAAATLLASNRLTWSEPIQTDEKNAYRAAGKQPYSVKIGDTWYSYQKLPPAIAFPLAMVSSINYLLENKKINDDAADMILTGIANYGNFLADQSYAKSIGDLLDAAKGEETAITRVISNYPQQLIPYRALGGWMARLFDPTQRKIDSTASFVDKQMQALMMNIPGLSQGVPARVDAQGNEILQPNPKRNAVLPINTSTENPKAASDYEKLENLRRLVSEQNIESKELTAQAEKLDAELSQLPREEANKRAVEIKKTNPELFAKIKGVAEARKKNLSATEKQMMQLGVTNGNRAEYINEQILKLATPADRNEYLSQLRKKKIATDEVLKQLRALNKK